MASGARLVEIDDILAARAAVAGVVAPTPCEASGPLSRLVGRTVWLKPEHLQRSGSFKIRGAHHHLSSLPPTGADGEPTTVVAASAGNHARAVTMAAAGLGLRSLLFMPDGVAGARLEAARAEGAEVRLGGATIGDCLVTARAHAARSGHRLVPAFDDRLVIAGQATVGLEVLDEVPDVETVVVPVGGGGLVAGIAAAVRARRPDVRVVGVQAAGADALARSLARGRLVVLERCDTIADAIAVRAPSALTIAHCRALVDRVVTVTDAEIGRALVLLLEQAGAVVEPAAAVGLAALVAGKVPGSGPAVAVVSGGNVDPGR